MIGAASASAMVKQGATTVLCSVKSELFQPSASASDSGLVDCQLRCDDPSADSALSEAIALLRDLVDKGAIIDRGQLCLVASRVAWLIKCNFMVLAAEKGNLLGVCVVALLVTLKSVSLPEIIVATTENAVVNLATGEGITLGHKKWPLSKVITDCPVVTSFAFFTAQDEKNQKQIIVDPTDDEIAACSGQLVVICGKKELLAVIAIDTLLTDAIIDSCVNSAVENQKPLEGVIDASLTL